MSRSSSASGIAGRGSSSGGPRSARGRWRRGSTPPRLSTCLNDPDALWERLESDAEEGGSSRYDRMFTRVGDSLRETAATSAQRAALYEVAARIPGVELLGRVTDRSGRPGLAVARVDEANATRHTLIFDPETSQLLGEEQAVVAGNAFGYPAGTVVGYATYEPAAIVGSVDERR